MLEKQLRLASRHRCCGFLQLQATLRVYSCTVRGNGHQSLMYWPSSALSSTNYLPRYVIHSLASFLVNNSRLTNAHTYIVVRANLVNMNEIHHAGFIHMRVSRPLHWPVHSGGWISYARCVTKRRPGGIAIAPFINVFKWIS